MAFWYNIQSGQVETDEERSPGADLMGPYDSREAAARALQSAAERTAAWDEADREWEGDDQDAPRSSSF